MLIGPARPTSPAPLISRLLSCQCPLCQLTISVIAAMLNRLTAFLNICRTDFYDEYISFQMMRGCCWVDCFGGFKMPFSSPSSRQASHLTADAPLDPAMLNRCLDAVRAHEENEKNKYAVRKTNCGENSTRLID